MVSVVVFVYGIRRGRNTFVYGLRRWIFNGLCPRRRIHNFRMYRAVPRFLFVFLGLVAVAAAKLSFMVSVVGFFYGFRRGKGRFVDMVSVVGCFVRFPAATGPRLSLRWKPFKKIPGRLRDELSIYIYIYIYIIIYNYIYIYIMHVYTCVLQTGVFGIVEMCLALMRQLAFRDHYARVFASRANICQVTRKPLFPKLLSREPQTRAGPAWRATRGYATHVILVLRVGFESQTGRVTGKHSSLGTELRASRLRPG